MIVHDEQHNFVNDVDVLFPLTVIDPEILNKAHVEQNHVVKCDDREHWCLNEYHYTSCEDQLAQLGNHYSNHCDWFA